MRHRCHASPWCFLKGGWNLQVRHLDGSANLDAVKKDALDPFCQEIEMLVEAREYYDVLNYCEYPFDKGILDIHITVVDEGGYLKEQHVWMAG
ncbi:predicted protein [Pyrenophora tritici-repentis Pt-1C-BFP]|uniref:Uncharacterized protein n=1 Tax=Pyrenophora tritici-repentis (strain Pt-1C-BFP) TaxID=426418 RepID=B2WMC5_PYRTR|nr:uncharacterized protein PTRG_11135 [Pyrenophora tritici-repentis Pt-1C-BFP]EDU44185.1 predicted protein [Pyrenophora tritici-repentis Pt-1C-BFP]